MMGAFSWVHIAVVVGVVTLLFGRNMVSKTMGDLGKTMKELGKVKKELDS